MPKDDFRRILVVVTRQLGDVLLTTPLIRAARQRWPGAQLDVLGFAGTLGLLRGNPDIDRLIEVPAGSGWRASWPLLRRLWRAYDLALIAQPSDRAHLYGLIAGRCRAGIVLGPAGKSWWQRLWLSHVVEVAAERGHVVLEKLALLAPWAADHAEVEVVPPPGAALPADVLARLAAGYVVFQVPSLVAYKQWPLGHCTQLVTALVGAGRPVVLTGSGSADDRAKVASVVDALPATVQAQVVDAAGRLDLNQVVTLLAGASLYIGPDTSITHLAAACSLPVVALYGPVDPRIFGPWPQGQGASQPWRPQHPQRQVAARITLLQGPQACVPCNRAGCEDHLASRSDCLPAITPERVMAEVHRLLALGRPTAGARR